MRESVHVCAQVSARARVRVLGVSRTCTRPVHELVNRRDDGFAFVGWRERVAVLLLTRIVLVVFHVEILDRGQIGKRSAATRRSGRCQLQRSRRALCALALVSIAQQTNRR